MTESDAAATAALTEAQGLALVRLARQAISEKLGLTPPPEEKTEMADNLREKLYQECRGTFVTLKKDNCLRGCIGNLAPTHPLAESIHQNALNAAFCDFRFRPLTAEELPRVKLEISILTEPRPLAFKDARDLAAKLRPGVDGVILRQGAACATFLPQVWDQLPDVEAFLTQLCMKACLPEDAWRRPGVEISTYQVQHFEES